MKSGSFHRDAYGLEAVQIQVDLMADSRYLNALSQGKPTPVAVQSHTIWDAGCSRH